MIGSEAKIIVSEAGMDVNSSKNMGDDDMLISAAIGSSVVPEASPDSLKNTPSNIAKLEDVIEHCVGRQKYLAQTRSPSDGGDVRWYFCKVPLLGNGEYFHFLHLQWYVFQCDL